MSMCNTEMNVQNEMALFSMDMSTGQYNWRENETNNPAERYPTTYSLKGVTNWTKHTQSATSKEAEDEEESSLVVATGDEEWASSLGPRGERFGPSGEVGRVLCPKFSLRGWVQLWFVIHLLQPRAKKCSRQPESAPKIESRNIHTASPPSPVSVKSGVCCNGYWLLGYMWICEVLCPYKSRFHIESLLSFVDLCCFDWFVSF